MTVLYNPADPLVDTFNEFFVPLGVKPIAKRYSILVDGDEDEGTSITVWRKNPIDGGFYRIGNNSKIKEVWLGYQNPKPF